ncbi:MAG: hypothetical protein LBI94_06990 [Treponema sp.]|jgi:hypothetical protein|nr:hypothetical protein [Treponema sp.]
MSRFSTPALFLCSLILALTLFLSFPLSREFFPGRGYAALALEDRGLDRETALALEDALGRPVLSESSQWVLLNNFGSLERIPLDEYDKRLESFDPRRDPYASRLRDFFVREGKRWFFIPLDREIFGPFPVLNPERSLKKKIAPALAAVPGLDAAAGSFSLLVKQADRPPGFRIIPFVLAWPAALFLAGGPFRKGRPGSAVRRIRRGPGTTSRSLFLLAPPLFVLSLWGAPGCALAALSLYLGALLAPLLRELWVQIIRGGEDRQKTALRPYRFDLVRALCLAPLSVPILWTGKIPPLTALLGLAGLFVLYFFYLGTQVRRFAPEDRPSCRFVPLPILSPRTSGRPGARPRAALPFALSSCLAFVLCPPAGFWRPLPEPWPFLVLEKDYADHALYQAGFSRRSLHLSGAASSGFSPSGYFRYTIGEDGLVAGILPGVPEAGGETEIPPFPLASLCGFLAGWAVPDPWVSGGRAAVVSPFLGLALILLPPGRGGGRKRSPAYDDKRIAA